MSKLIRISADLASGRGLNNLFGCCESQKTISTNVLRGELEAIAGDLKAKGIAVKDAYTENQALRNELEAVKAEQLNGYIENMRLLENEANLQDKAGLRMMCSFAVKTATEYASQVEKGQ